MTENEILDAMLDNAMDEHEELLAYRAIGTVEECRDAVKNRDKAIEEFAEKVKTSPNAHLWCCNDLSLEFCSMDDCEVCMDKFKKQIDEITEQMKQTHECD